MPSQESFVAAAATKGRVDISLPMRTCPACGGQTEADYCPADGTRTLQMQALRPDATQLFAGELIADRYRVTEVIGRGGFGAVYRAVHTGTRQPVALKLLHVRDAAAGGFDEVDARRFFREAEITASLRHPNTVRVFDLGQTERGALYLAMELLEGQTLEARLRKFGLEGQWMPVDDVVRVANDVLGSLAEAHDRGLVHRDLKPANLMLTTVAGDPVTKVLDFGIARQQGSSLTSGSAAVGTPQYMAPEQCMGQPIDGRADLYALGVILYRCLAGVLPFDDGNPMAVMMKQVSEPAPDLLARAGPRVPRPLGQLVLRALAKDPADRFADARTMRAALAAALAEPDRRVVGALPTAVPGPGPTTTPLQPLPTPHTGATPAALAADDAVATARAWAPPRPAVGARIGVGVIALAAAAAAVWWLVRPTVPLAGAPRAHALADVGDPDRVAVAMPARSAGAAPAAPAAAATPTASAAMPTAAPATAVPQPREHPAAADSVPPPWTEPPPRKPMRDKAARPRTVEQKHYVD